MAAEYLIAAAVAAAAGVHSAAVEARLAMFVGDWTIEGMETNYRETCDWYPQRSFVVCNTSEIENGETNHSVSVLGYSSLAKTYSYLHYSSSGSSRTETGYETPGGGLVYLRERATDAGISQYRSRITPIAGTRSFSFAQEKSDNGGPWQQTVKFNYVLRKP